MKVLQINQQENSKNMKVLQINKLTLNTRRALQIGQQLKPSNKEDIAWKKLGKNITHPHFQIENEDGVQGLDWDWDFLFIMCCITFF